MAYWEVLRETLLDSLITLPILLAVYFLIEFIEYKWATKLQKNRFLRGKASPVLAALVGSVPQCGFSVVATDLFAQGMIPVGALLAVFIATNDEALPLLLAHPQSWVSVLVLVVAKIVIAVVVGYAANLAYRGLFRRQVVAAKTAAHNDTQDDHDHELNLHDGCCHHSMTTKRFDWRHPLLHSLKIWAFIVVVSLLFGFVADIWVGQDRLTAFLSASVGLQPLLAVLVGLIPNCAASVVLTELYLVGGLRFGALLGGLCVNAGLGIVFLLRQKRLWREKLFVVAWLLITSLVVGYGFLWLAI
ncbi:MAG: arsenic efflux protein [Prevotella sp.]|nr:arsenic efflux protein [Prevotella sp.]